MVNEKRKIGYRGRYLSDCMIRARVPQDLHRAIADAAKRCGISVSEWLKRAVIAALAAEDLDNDC